MASSRGCSWFATVLVFLLAVVTAKEIVPTKEWQRLAENETIPAGMHVRMDLTTGGKWVKLMDEDEEDEKETASHGHKRTQTSHELAVTIAPDGSIQDIDDSNNEDNSNNKTTHTPKYDFDMMYRTLAKLPPDALEAMGGLPATSLERSAFETQLLTIWEARQAELLDLELNLPEVLKARIASLEEYLANPRKELKKIKLKKNNKTTKEPTTTSSNTAGLVTNIVEVLHDLEVQVADIDMARDFHTLGGWPVLVRVLRLSTDKLLNVTAIATDAEASKQYRRNVKLMTRLRLVQTHAAWVMGTAVKNIDEFFPYGIEPIPVDVEEKATTTTTALDVLLELFCKNYEQDTVTDQVEYEADEKEDEVYQNKAQAVHEVLALRTKLVYGMGAILRGNHAAQTHLAQTGQLERFRDMYQHLVSAPREGLLVAAELTGDEETTVHATALHRKLIQRVTALVIDLVEERVARPLDPATRSTNDDDDAAPTDADALVVTFSAAFCTATCDYYLAAIGAAYYVAAMSTGNPVDPATTAMAGIPVPLQATFVRGLGVMGHACPATACTGGGSGPGLPALVKIIQADWSRRKATFDDEQYHDLQTSLVTALQSLQQRTNMEAAAVAASAATTTAATA